MTHPGRVTLISNYTSHRHKLSFFAMCQSDVQQHERRDDRYHPSRLSRLCAFALNGERKDAKTQRTKIAVYTGVEYTHTK